MLFPTLITVIVCLMLVAGGAWVVWSSLHAAQANKIQMQIIWLLTVAAFTFTLVSGWSMIRTPIDFLFITSCSSLIAGLVAGTSYWIWTTGKRIVDMCRQKV